MAQPAAPARAHRRRHPASAFSRLTAAVTPRALMVLAMVLLALCTSPAAAGKPTSSGGGGGGKEPTSGGDGGGKKSKPPPPPSPSPSPPSPPPSPRPPSPPPPPPPSPHPPLSPSPPPPPSPSPPSPPSASTQSSALWGSAGELWTGTSGRLFDFSWAGYNSSLSEPPRPAATVSIMSHGAVGDGVADDTTAFEAAINATAAGGVLYIPAGTYRIARNVTIRKPIVIRGDGMNLTTLYYPFSFGDLYPEALAANSRAFSFGPLMLTFSCSDSISSTTRLAYVAANVTRGDTVIPVTSTSGFSVGQTVRVAADDRNGKLVAYIYGNSLVSDWSDNINDTNVIRFLSPIKSIDAAAGTITLLRPLPYDLDVTNWAAVAVHRYAPSCSGNVGVEDLSIRFPFTTYGGHFTEKGYNALGLSNLHNCWVRNVRITNSDFGIKAGNTNFCTFDNIVVDVTASRGSTNGHHAIELTRGTENIVQNSFINTKHVHDLSLELYILHTVWKNVRGVDLNLDYHRRGSYGNLASNISCGACTRPWASGGSSNRGPHAGAFNTFWNWYHSSGTGSWNLPTDTYGPYLNFIGYGKNTAALTSPYFWHKETVASGYTLVPAELHASMLAKRLASPGGIATAAAAAASRR